MIPAKTLILFQSEVLVLQTELVAGMILDFQVVNLRINLCLNAGLKLKNSTIILSKSKKRRQN